MRGEIASLPDIVLESLVLPVNLLSDESFNESLSPDVEAEEEHSFRIDTECHFCNTQIRLCVGATTEAIRHLQSLLLDQLHLLCPGCARSCCREHGRIN